MFEFTLLKSLFFEMDKYKMEGVTETKDQQITSRRMEVSYDRVPQIHSITAQERILPMVDRYYFFVNDEPLPAELSRVEVRQVIYEFYKEHFPQYLKKDLPDDMTDVNILDCFEVFRTPDYRPKHAFPGLVTLEDIRNGNVHDEDLPKHSFPGLRLLTGSEKEALSKEKPMASTYDGYTAFDAEDTDKAREQVNDKLAAMKMQFAAQMKEIGVTDELLASLSEKKE